MGFPICCPTRKVEDFILSKIEARTTTPDKMGNKKASADDMRMLTFDLKRDEAQNDLIAKFRNMMSDVPEIMTGWSGAAILAACALAIIVGSIVWYYRESIQGFISAKKNN